MRFTEPRGHAGILDGLWRSARARRLAHALLFTGPEGVGKHLTAERLAFGLLCAEGPGRPCGRCGPCKRLRADAHPDAFVVDAQAEGEEQILISRITARPEDPQENVTTFLSLKPMEGGFRVVLIRDAERLNDASQNALLKTLEEPGAGAVLVLSSSRPDLLLETTRSRCLRIDFAPLAVEEVSALLRGADGETGLDAESAAALARWSGGAPGEALRLAARGALAMRAILERVVSGEIDALAAAAEVEEVEGEFPGKTPTASARTRARAFLDLELAVLRDLRRAAAGVDPRRLAHGDLATGLGTPLRLTALAEALDQGLLARQDVEANLAPDAAVERALLALERRSPAVSSGSARRHLEP